MRSAKEKVMVFDSINPATGEKVNSYREMTATELLKRFIKNSKRSLSTRSAS